MTYSDFQQEGYKLSAAELKIYEKKIEKYYSDAFKLIDAKINKQYLKLSGVNKADYYNELLKFNRLKIMLDEIAEDYKGYAKKAGKDTVQGLREAMQNNYNRQQFALAWSATDAKYTVLPKSIIEVAALGTDETIKQVTAAVADKFGAAPLYMPQVGSLSKLIADNASKEIAAIQREIISGLRNGQAYKKTADAIKEIIGYKYREEGVLKAKGALASAKRIIQTEGTRVLNAAGYANDRQAEAQGIEITREWQATLDGKTRDRHQALDGQKTTVDKPFTIGGESAMYPGDFPSASNNIRCRCTVISYTEGMRPGIRSGRNPVSGKTETFTYRSYPEWLEMVS